MPNIIYIYIAVQRILLFIEKNILLKKKSQPFLPRNTTYMCAGILHKCNMERQKKENGCLGKIWKDVQTPT